MSRTVFCRKYQSEQEGLARPPFPGPKGQDIYDNVSKQAWQEWLHEQTMLINEKHLNVMDPEAKGGSPLSACWQVNGGAGFVPSAAFALRAKRQQVVVTGGGGVARHHKKGPALLSEAFCMVPGGGITPERDGPGSETLPG